MADITGLAELQATFASLQADMAKQLPGMVERAAGTIKQEIETRMHVDTGELKNSLEIVQTAREHSASATVQIHNSGPDAQVHYAIFQEYGTSNMQARPFFRPGVEAAKDTVQAQLVGDVITVVEQNGR